MFRVASKPEVGGGHVGRSRALGAEVHETLPVTFVLDRDGLSWKEALQRQGFEVFSAVDSFEGRRWSGILTDSYDLDDNEFARLRAFTCPLVAIVDTVTPVPGYDLLINSAPGLEGDHLGGVPALLGSRYALIDQAFRLQARVPGPSGAIKILICFGLVDVDDYCGKALTAIDVLSPTLQLDVVVLVGHRCPNLERLKRRAAASRHRIELRIDEFNMAGVLADIDFVVGAGGVSLLERMAMGVPSLSIAVAENQNKVLIGASAAGATLAVPADTASDSISFAEVIEAFIDDDASRAEMAQRARAMVDGRGVERVAEVLLDLARNGLQNRMLPPERLHAE